MTISVFDPTRQTIIFIILLAIIVIATSKKRQENSVFSILATTEMKGLAILSIILAHIGFGLASSNQFLQPLSSWGGVGVNVFFFLSGFGLTISTLKKSLTPLQFYWRRLSKVLIPLWISLIIILFLDKILLDLTHPLGEVIKAFLGFFPRADLATSINSPLWFLTPLIFYYLIYPLIFIKKLPELSAFIIAFIGYYLLKFNLPIHPDLKVLWQLHYLAFPVGMIFASLINRLPQINFKPLWRYTSLALLIIAWLYFFKNSEVGGEKINEQLISILAVLLTAFIFILKPIQNKFLYWLGLFSYEIYLWHWPLMYRYDFIFKYVSPALGTFLYLLFFLLLGFLIMKLKQKIFKQKTG